MILKKSKEKDYELKIENMKSDCFLVRIYKRVKLLWIEIFYYYNE